MTTIDEAAMVAREWVRGPMLITLQEQLEILHAHSNAARRELIAILQDEREWARICALGDERLKASVDRYGDRSFHKTPDELLQELREELADARAYLAMRREREGGR